MSKKSQIIILLATSILTFMSTVDMSIVNTAMPQISNDLNIPMNEAEWIASSYLILICMLLILFGKIGDQIGRTHVFQLGTLIFIGGSLICGFSEDLPILLIARIFQGTGASMLMSTNFGIITELFPRNQHGRALSINSVFAQIGNISGPVLAGLILSITSWHWLFFINLPVGIIAYLFGQAVFPKKPFNFHDIHIDWLGFVSFAMTILSFFLAIYIGQAIGYNQPIVLILFIIAIILLGVFIYIENHVKDPLLELSLFKKPGFSIGIIVAIFVFIIVYFNNMIMPFYLQNRLGFTPSKMSFILMIIPLLNVFSSPLGGYMADKIGAEKICLIALFIFIISEGIFTTIQPSWSLMLLIVGFVVFGFANGLFQNNPLIMSNVGAADQGIAGSIAALSRNIGFTVGLAISTTLLYLGMGIKSGTHITSYPHAHPEWFMFGMHFTYGFALLLVLISIVLLGSLVWKRHSISRNEDLS